MRRPAPSHASGPREGAALSLPIDEEGGEARPSMMCNAYNRQDSPGCYFASVSATTSRVTVAAQTSSVASPQQSRAQLQSCFAAPCWLAA
jgi:hypothetical protein